MGFSWVSRFFVRPRHAVSSVSDIGGLALSNVGLSNLCEVLQGVEGMGGAETLTVLPVASLYPAVVPDVLRVRKMDGLPV